MRKTRKKGVRWTLLVLLWAWGAVMFLVVDLFASPDELDRMRPDSELYRATQVVAHEMVGRAYDEEPVVDTQVVRRAQGNNHLPRDGKWHEWHENGTVALEGRFKNGLRHGAWSTFFEDGRPATRESFRNGLSDGSIERFHRNGKEAARGNYVSGKRDGAWRLWHEDGTPACEEEYVSGKRAGERRAWHASGQVAEESHYVDGRLHGARRTFQHDGVPREEGRFENGKPVERWTYWNEGGKVVSVKLYEKAKVIRTDDYAKSPHPLDWKGRQP